MLLTLAVGVTPMGKTANQSGMEAVTPRLIDLPLCLIGYMKKLSCCYPDVSSAVLCFAFEMP